MAQDKYRGQGNEEGEPLSAYQRLQAFIGICDSGGKQLSENTGKRLRELLEQKRDRCSARGAAQEAR